MAVSDSAPTLLIWDEASEFFEGASLVVTIAIESPDRESKCLRIFVEETGRQAAETPVWCSDPYQIITLPLDPSALPASGAATLRLQLDNGQGHVWFFAPDASAIGGLEYHLPHLIKTGQPARDFTHALCSMASLQTFSWKEGCVLDGLRALEKTGKYPDAAATVLSHLRYFGFDSGDLVYECPRGRRIRNSFTSIETTLPFAAIVAIAPDHPWIDLALAYWQSQLDTYGQVHEGEMISSEGAYTVAYPMAAIGLARGEERWVKIAEDLLIETHHRLVRPEGHYLRHFSDGKRTHRNWARGLAWLLLGHAQTLRIHPSPPKQLQEQLEQITSFAVRHQNSEGLWHCFVDEPQVPPDTAGSAGIAAGMAIAIDAGLLPEQYRDSVLHAREALNQHITQEGFLDGCSQSNKAGEELQRSPYRVTTPYALGLMGLLEASL
jgi:unsaturated rhamnogalacturonyl hydrolase